MSWQSKVLGLCKRYGSAAKFAATTILGAVVPGSPAVISLVEKAFDAAQQTGQSDWEINVANQLQTTADNQARLEQMLDVLSGDFQAVFEDLAHIKQMPRQSEQRLAQRVEEILADAKANQKEWQRVANNLDNIAHRFDVLEQQGNKLLEGQQEALGLLRGMAAASDQPKEPVIDRAGRGQFRTLGEALDASEDGAVFRIKPGNYSESVEFTKSFELIGDGDPARTVLTASGHFRGTADRVVLRYVTLRGSDNYILEWFDGELVLEDCVVDGSMLVGADSLFVRDPSARVVIRNSTLRNGDTGVQVDCAKQLTVENSRISAGYMGFLIRDCKRVQIVRCTIEGCQIGIQDSGDVRGSVEGCKFRGVNHELVGPDGSGDDPRAGSGLRLR